MVSETSEVYWDERYHAAMFLDKESAQRLTHFLEEHETEICCAEEGYGDLYSVFVKVFGREPVGE